MSLGLLLKMNPIGVDELFTRKAFNDTTDYEIQVTATYVDQYLTLKVNEQTEDANIIYEHKDTKSVYARVCDTVDAEEIT